MSDLSTAIALAISLGIGGILIRLAPMIRPFLRDRNDAGAVQASHVGEPLRLGGLALLAGVCLGVVALPGTGQGWYALILLLTAIPVVVAGLCEDAGRCLSPRLRLGAAAVSSVLALAALGIWLPRGDLPLMDVAMTVAPVAMFFTVFFASGYCHALNLIDGMNGLAAATIILGATGLGLIATQSGLPNISLTAYLVAAAAVGFLMTNWPASRLMLGDAGAYGIGHVLAWLAISVVALAPDVSAPAVLLTLFWPVADAAHSMWRRWSEGRSMFEPDRMHLHQKIRRGLEVALVGRGRRHLSNPLTTLVMVPMIAAPVATGVALADSGAAAGWGAFVFFSVLFSVSHPIAARAARKLRRRLPAEADGASEEIMTDAARVPSIV